MAYYEKYDITVMVASFILFFISFFFLLRKKIFSIIDPLLLNLIWCASSLALLMGYFASKDINLDWAVFVCVYFIYVFGLYFFIDKSPRDIHSLNKGLYDNKNVKIFIICLLLNLFSRYEFIVFAMSNPSMESWFMYRFQQMETRGVAQFIAQIGARPFFLYYLFVLLKTKKNWRFTLIIILIGNSVLDIIAGGRSSVLGLVEAYGYFIFYFSPLFSKKFVKKINLYGGFMLVFPIINAVVVTYFYNSESTISDSALRMINRLLAAADGLEMYLANNAPLHIKMGFIEYLKATFGIFIKRAINIDTQSMGWQLYELDAGRPSHVAVGPNFVLPLQVVMIGKIFFLPYSLVAAYIIAFLRGNKLSKKYIRSQPLSYVLGILAFQLAIDLEFFVFQLCSVLFIYFTFIFPVRKISINFDWSAVFLSLKNERLYNNKGSIR